MSPHEVRYSSEIIELVGRLQGAGASKHVFMADAFRFIQCAVAVPPHILASIKWASDYAFSEAAPDCGMLAAADFRLLHRLLTESPIERLAALAPPEPTPGRAPPRPGPERAQRASTDKTGPPPDISRSTPSARLPQPQAQRCQQPRAPPAILDQLGSNNSQRQGFAPQP